MAYQVELDVFEGPLDLLLFLIQQARIDIKDIFISDIVNQYIEYVERLKETDIERTSVFIPMAAQLMEIKSRRMLPRNEEEEQDLEEAEEDLIRRIENYKRYKEACKLLADMHEDAANILNRRPEEIVVSENFDITSVSIRALAQAMSELLKRIPDPEEEHRAEREIQREVFTVKEKILHVMKRLSKEREISFVSLFDRNVTREEVVTTVMALLELVKRNKVHLIQHHFADELRIARKDNT